MVAVPALAATDVKGNKSDQNGPLVVAGRLPEPEARSERFGPGHIAAVDGDRRLMYYVYDDADHVVHVVTYDLRPEIPRPVDSGVLGPDGAAPWILSPYEAALDTKRDRLLLLSVNLELDGQTATTFTPNLFVYDTVRQRRTAIWYPDKLVPGFYPIGMTYSAADDRVYLVGEFSATWLGVSSAPTFGSKAVGPVTSVVALDAGTGNLEWIRPIPECQQALFSLNIGGLIARSAVRDALYVPCTTGGVTAMSNYPGQAGLVRLTIDPEADSTASAATFPLDFFPVSGQYFNGAGTGIATFDPQSDRVFMQSLSLSTPGAWVFDGRLSAWVGFIPAGTDSDQFAGFNEHLGHLYVSQFRNTGDSTNGTIVSDGRSLPVQAGAFQSLVTSHFIVTDPKSDRLFVLDESAPQTWSPHLVLHDTYRKSPSLRSLDYDTLTDGVSEADAAFVSYSADVNAYGADIVAVGGLSAPLTLSGPFRVKPPAGKGTRGLMLARIGGLGVRPAGASASARAVTADLQTTQDWETNGALKEWPYPTVSCLDSGGGIKPQSSDVNGAHALVSCDLAKSTSHGETSAGVLRTDGLTVGGATSSADIVRTSKDGATTTVSAASSAIAVDVPGVGELHIGRVTGRLTTAAHGVPGSASATYHRVVRGVEVVAPDGTSLLGPAACESTIAASSAGEPRLVDSCGDLAASINRLTQTRVHVGFPLPGVVTTPKGAYAAVEQTDADYYGEKTGNDQGVVFPQDSTALRPTPALQLVVYNDVAERSRLIAQFAGVQGDSIFDTTAEADTPPGPPDGDVGDPTQLDAPDAPPAPRVDRSVPNGQTVQPPGSGAPPVVAQPLTGVAGWLFVHRSLRDALLVAGILGIAVAAGLLAYRRHQLLTAMTATTGGPST
jgi:hypothetical protein